MELRDGLIRVSHKREPLKPRSLGKAVAEPERIVIVGGGAAGFAAAEMLRREGYQNSIVMLSEDTALPCDRPNLSKDYLAGTIPFEYVPLRDEGFYEENNIDTRLGRPAQEIDVRAREVVLAGDDRVPYDRLLLATGAEPVRLTIPGADQLLVHTLRSLADCRAIIEVAKTASRAVVIRGELHWARSRRLTPRAQTGGPCRGTGQATDGARSRLGHGCIHSRTPPTAWRGFSPGKQANGNRR